RSVPLQMPGRFLFKGDHGSELPFFKVKAGHVCVLFVVVGDKIQMVLTGVDGTGYSVRLFRIRREGDRLFPFFGKTALVGIAEPLDPGKAGLLRTDGKQMYRGLTAD